VVREPYLSGFIVILKTGFQVTGSSAVHGFRVQGFWILVGSLMID
jgi:hypothetical protein